jgi:NOL1/NOP2/sun family putative RNA methylase
MKQELIARYKEMCSDFSVERNIRNALRINTLKITEKECVKRLVDKGVKLEKIKFLKNGYYYESKFSLSSTPEYLQGMIYLQDAASQIPAEVLDPKTGENILDMSAAPGSKTTQIAQLMQNKGTIIALDTSHSRIEALKNNLERCSASNCAVYKKDARFANELRIKFDKILLDAPCSGNYTQEEDWLSKRNVEDFKSNARMQKEMIRAGIKCLKDKGILVYSTCSLEPEENEFVVQWAINNLDVELLDTDEKIGDKCKINILGKELNKDINKCVKIWPYKTGMQGFFIAKMRKR